MACVAAAFRDADGGSDGAGPTPQELDALIARSTVNLLEADGALKGVIVLEPFEDHLFAVAIAVHPGHRRQGVGRRLVAFAESEARRRNLGAIRLFAERRAAPSLAFYHRLGFVPDAPDAHGGPELALVKRLGHGLTPAAPSAV